MRQSPIWIQVGYLNTSNNVSTVSSKDSRQTEYLRLMNYDDPVDSGNVIISYEQSKSYVK